MVIRKSGGYTLIELMTVVAIMGAVGSIGALVMQQAFRSQMMANALSTIQQGAFNSFDVISKLLRQGSAASVVVDRYDSNQPPCSRITFTVPSTGRTVCFYQRQQYLYVGAVRTFGSLRSLTFAYPKSSDSYAISVSMTFEKSVGSGSSKAVQLYVQRVKIQND